ncbi:MAG: MipA/OmpV family protein [Chitinimonas sp.]|nr:MipA/OmpV family protein [Chitinimonas sp.]
MLRTTLIAALLAPFPLTTLAQTEPWSVGIGVGGGQAIDHDQDNKPMPMPLLRYRGERAFVEGDTVGVSVFDTAKLSGALLLRSEMQEFNPADAKQLAFARLDKRRASPLAGMQLSYRPGQFDSLAFTVYGDISQHHRSVIPAIGWQHRFAASGPDTQYFSSAELRFHGKKYNRYYYGISAAESARSGLAAHAPAASEQFEYALGVNHRISPSWSLTAIASVRKIGRELDDSPMVARRRVASLLAGASYRLD